MPDTATLTVPYEVVDADRYGDFRGLLVEVFIAIRTGQYEDPFYTSTGVLELARAYADTREARMTGRTVHTGPTEVVPYGEVVGLLSAVVAAYHGVSA